MYIISSKLNSAFNTIGKATADKTTTKLVAKTHAFAFAWIINSNMRSCSESVCEILNIFVLLDKFFFFASSCYELPFTFLSFSFFTLFLWSFWCTTFIFLSLRCIIFRRAAKKLSHFFFLNSVVLRVFFADDFGIRIDEIILKRNFFHMLLLFLRRLRNRSE